MKEYKLSDISIGMTETFTKRITVEMEDKFREISGDENPLHKDDNFAVEISNGRFKTHVTFGMLTASLYSTLAGMYLPGKYSLIHSFEELSFVQPVFLGDVLTVSGEVLSKDETLRLIRIKVKIKNQESKIVSKGKMKILVIK